MSTTTDENLVYFIRLTRTDGTHSTVSIRGKAVVAETVKHLLAGPNADTIRLIQIVPRVVPDCFVADEDGREFDHPEHVDVVDDGRRVLA